MSLAREKCYRKLYLPGLLIRHESLYNFECLVRSHTYHLDLLSLIDDLSRPTSTLGMNVSESNEGDENDPFYSAERVNERHKPCSPPTDRDRSAPALFSAEYARVSMRRSIEGRLN